MKIVLISEYNIYTTIGGTETYVDLLLKGLVGEGHKIVVITKGMQPISAGIEQKIADGASIYFLPKRVYTKNEIRQRSVCSTWPEFQKILEKEKPDIVHVHTLSTFFNYRHLILCRQAEYTTCFTTHVPGHFCSRGDLIQNNQQPCDGKVGSKCIRCLFSKGMRTGVSGFIKGYYLRPLRLLDSIREAGIRLICVSEWQKQHAILNGFPGDQISVIRQAISLKEAQVKNISEESSNVLRIGYLGRFSPEKGSGFLLKLIGNMKGDTQVQFVLGIPVSNSDPEEIAKLSVLQSEMDSQLKVLDDINSSNKAFYFQQIDCLLIPSFFWETGPIVLLEALSYSKPVLAVQLGGTAEYAIEFPDMVKTYEWGNEADAERKVQEMKTKTIARVSRLNIFNQLKEKEIQFIEKHLEVYQKIKA